jgi:formate hydrogenlyase subunit 3/multisubunit Na+/H+ antiporter MnhD subunit
MPAVGALSCVAVLLLMAVFAVAVARFASMFIYAMSFAACALGVVSALALLLGGAMPVEFALPLGLPGVGMHLRIDALSAFFVTVINLGGAAASLYAIGYGRHETEPLRVVPYYPAYIAAMNIVVLADDAFTFLVAWEFMSLVSWALVLAQHRVASNMRAAYVYIVMASAGTLCLLLAFGLLAGPDGGYAFAQMRTHHLEPLAAGLVLLLVLAGAGGKAGLVPLHVWLPLAHPAAPSHVSALMSGVMTKVAVYGFIRIVFDLLGPSDPWGSMVVLALGGISTAIGVLYALMQQDLKRLLAYSTVENIGVIFIGLGLAMAFRANGLDWAAALAFTAALLHVFNHSLFKSLLFFGAGAVLTATGERNMEKLGGLIHRMPRTALVFLVGCASISALPPLNGFVSEWLTFQAILVSYLHPQWGLKFLIPAVGALLALSAAFAAACFVKAYGITFLGRLRMNAPEKIIDVDWFSLSAMYALAALCLFAGVFPGLVLEMLAPVARAVVGTALPDGGSSPWMTLAPIAQGRSSYNGLIILAFLAIAGGATAMFIHRFATRATRRSAIWDCGFPDPSLATQYSGSSFAMPIRRVFGTTIFEVHETLDMPRPGETRAGRFHVKIFDPSWRLAYGPLARLVTSVSLRLNRLQFLTIRSYLTLVFVTLILLLIVVVAWR